MADIKDLTGLGQLADSKFANKVYDDLLAEPTKEAGKVLTDTFKAFRLFTSPLQLLALGQDRLARFLDRVRNKVPEERQIDAHPQIAGPVLENLRYMEEGSILTEMYLNLLARAIDQERVGEAHPAFPKVIEQLCPEEALLLFFFQKNESKGNYVTEYTLKHAVPEPLSTSTHLGMYREHLVALNLLVERAAGQTTYLVISAFGELFIRACIPEDIAFQDQAKMRAQGGEQENVPK